MRMALFIGLLAAAPLAACVSNPGVDDYRYYGAPPRHRAFLYGPGGPRNWAWRDPAGYGGGFGGPRFRAAPGPYRWSRSEPPPPVAFPDGDRRGPPVAARPAPIGPGPLGTPSAGVVISPGPPGPPSHPAAAPQCRPGLC